MSAGTTACDALMDLYSHLAPQQKPSLYYYPEKALKRIRDGQLGLLCEECVKAGLLVRQGAQYALSEKGHLAVAAQDASVLLPPYRRAKKRINLLYVDVLI